MAASDSAAKKKEFSSSTSHGVESSTKVAEYRVYTLKLAYV